jgi:S-adenosylmethionine synthetase
VARPVSIMVETCGTSEIDPHKLGALVQEHFDLRPAAIIERLDLRRPIYQKTAAYGHFGRSESTFSWERTDEAEVLRTAAEALA